MSKRRWRHEIRIRLPLVAQKCHTCHFVGGLSDVGFATGLLNKGENCVKTSLSKQLFANKVVQSNTNQARKMTLVYLTLVCWGPDMIIRGSVIWWSPVRALSIAKHVLRQFVLAVNRLCGAKRCGVCVNFQNFVLEVAHEIAFPFWISCLQSVSHAQTRT